RDRPAFANRPQQRSSHAESRSAARRFVGAVSPAETGTLAMHRPLLQLAAALRVHVISVIGRFIFRALRRSTLVRAIFSHRFLRCERSQDQRRKSRTWQAACDFISLQRPGMSRTKLIAACTITAVLAG